MAKSRTSKNAAAVNFSFDAAAAFETKLTAGPERVLQLGFVLLPDDHPRPREGITYPVVSASSGEVGAVPVPQTSFRRMHLDLYEFFIDDMPDFFIAKNNEGLLKVAVTTKNPKDLDGGSFEVTVVNEFRGRPNSYAPKFLYRGICRNILLEEWVNIKFELYERDTDSSEYYERIKGVIDKVPDIKNLNILMGIPYLNLASRLFDGIITTFGRNPDDHLWGELPIMEVDPTPGGAFLRTGIYVLAERTNSKKETIPLSSLKYKDGHVILGKTTNGVKRLSNHLIFGVKVVEHVLA